MITVALIIFAASLLIYGKMPLLGGKMARGAKVRAAGAIILLLCACSFFLPAGVSIILNIFIISGAGGFYFFAKGENPTEKESRYLLFSSPQDEKDAYLSAIAGLVIVGLVIAGSGFGVWLLLNFIRG